MEKFQKNKDRLLLMTDVPGVNDKNGKLLEINNSEASILISKIIIEGMIPKILTCISCIKDKIPGVVITIETTWKFYTNYFLKLVREL